MAAKRAVKLRILAVVACDQKVVADPKAAAAINPPKTELLNFLTVMKTTTNAAALVNAENKLRR